MAAVALLAKPLSGRADIDPPGCNGSGLGIELNADRQVAHIGDTITYSVRVFNRPLPNCKATDLTASVKTPDGVVHNIDVSGLALAPGQESPTRYVVTYVIRSQDLVSENVPGFGPLGVLKAEARTDGLIHQNVINSVGNAFQSLNTYVVQPCIEVTRICDVAGAQINVSGIVKNCGDIDLTDIFVTNVVGTASVRIAGPFTLKRGESTNYAGSYIPADPCVASTGKSVATGRDTIASPNFVSRVVSAEASSTCQLSFNPGLEVTHDCPATPPALGQAIAFRSTVRNSGNITLNNVAVSNNGTVVTTIPTLAPGATVTVANSLPGSACSVASTLTAAATTTCGGPVTAAAKSVTCTVLTAPAILVSHACPATVQPGGAVNYTGKVRNTGNVELKNVQVVADQPAAGTVVATIASLAPGAESNFTGTYTAPPTGCSTTVRLAAAGKDACTSADVANSTTGTCPIVTSPAISITRDCPAAGAAVGGTLTYNATVSNTGNVALTDVVVISGRPAANTRVFGPVTLQPGETKTFTGSFAVPANVCSISDTLVASGKDACSSAPVQNSVTKECPVQTDAALEVTHDCPAAGAVIGQAVAFRSTVKNTGNVSLSNVSVSNNGTVVTTIPTLAPGAVVTVANSLPNVGCSVSSTLTASGTAACGGQITAAPKSVTCLVQTSPGIAVTHACPAAIQQGGQVNYTGKVRNTGNVELKNVQVVADQPAAGTVVATIASIAPGAESSFSGSYTAGIGVCSTTVRLVATGKDACTSVDVSNNTTGTCPVQTQPSISITRECPATVVAAGGTLTYSATVANTGNVALTEVVVVSGRPAANTRVFGPVTLLPGESKTFTASFAVPGNVCSVSDTLVASGKDQCTSAPVQNSVTKECPVQTSGSINVTLVCGTAPVAPGGTVTYSGAVSNPGSSTIKDVKVVSSTGKTLFTVATLAPGASANYSGSDTAPTGACDVTVSVTASAADNCGGSSVTASKTATCPITTTPKLEISHACPPQATAVGQPLVFTGTVRNTGNVALKDVRVVNSLTGSGAPVFGPVDLAVGASATFSGSFTVPANQAGCAVTYTLTATGTDVCSNKAATPATVNASCPVTRRPAIEVTRDCPPGPVAQGALLKYTGTVRNTGNADLTDVEVTSSIQGSKAVFTIRSLAAGASVNFPGSFRVPTNCCTISETLTARAKEVCTGTVVSDTGTRTCPVLFTPKLGVGKLCPDQPVSVGDTLRFRAAVANMGDVTLVNVIVESIHGESRVKVHGPISLAPGEKVNFDASYVVPADSCGDDLLVATGRSICGVDAPAASISTPCKIETHPAVEVIKTCPSVPVRPGELYAFSGTVYNRGDVTLRDITVVNDQPAKGTVVFRIASLAPGKSADFTASYPLTKYCCDVVDTFTVTGFNRCDGLPCVHTSTAVCPVATRPALDLVKRCPTAGGVPSISGTVRNAGDTVLTNVTVFTLAGGESRTVILSSFELAPGESADFSVPATGNEPDYVISATGNDVCRGTLTSVSATCAGVINAGAENNPPIKISQISASGSQVSVTWNSAIGAVYRLQAADNPTSPAWKDCTGDITAQASTSTTTDDSGGRVRLYRVIQVK